MSMQIATFPAGDMTSDQAMAWSNLQRQNARFDSPYFRPEFTQAVAEVRPQTEVAMMSLGDEPVGFLPFGRTGPKTGIPVGSVLCDFQGAITRPRLNYDPLHLIRECDLTSWRYCHLITAQPKFIQHSWKLAESPYANLSHGFEEYHRSLNPRTMSDLRRKRNKLEREVGDVRFVRNASDPHFIETLMEWKSQQYARTGVLDVFQFDWVRDLLARLLAYQGEDFSAVNSVLYAGDEVVAMCYLMQSRHVLHYWFPAYNTQFARYSPGKQLLMEVLRQAPDWGVTRVDFGKGDEDYKASFSTDATIVAEGVIDRLPVRSGLRQASYIARQCLRTTSLKAHLQFAGRALYKLRGRLELQ